MTLFLVSFSIPVPILVFCASILPILGFYVCRAIVKQRKRTSRLQDCIGCIPAMVIRVGLEAESWREGWVIQAMWVDEKTRQTYTFNSTPQELRPKQHIGDSVLVFIHSNDPMQYSMEL